MPNMTQTVSNPNELVSALADGELRDAAFVQALQWLQDSEDARASWHAYHLLGDVLRSKDLAASGAHDIAFVERLHQRLQVGAKLAPSDMAIELMSNARHRQTGSGIRAHGKVSANDASMRWKLVAGFAGAAAVAVVTWNLMSGSSAPASEPQLAQVELLPATGHSPIMIRDPQLDELLTAHQQSAGISALQMPAGFLRNATYERPAR
jgi:sigma-E factor negative regulatory protein RseA